jgi:hypothetical protein
MVNWDIPSPNCMHGVYPINWLLSLAPKELELHGSDRIMSMAEFSTLVQGTPKRFLKSSQGTSLIFTDGGQVHGVPTAAVFYSRREAHNLKILLPQFYSDSFSRELIAILAALARATASSYPAIITDSKSVLSQNAAAKSSNTHPWLVTLLSELPASTMIYVPSHQKQKLARDRGKWQKTFSTLQAKYGADYTLYSRGNELADQLASSDNPYDLYTLVGLGHKVLAPGHVNLIPLSEKAIWDGKVAKRIRDSQQEAKWQEIESFPKIGAAWRLLKERGANLNIFFSAALSHSPALLNMASFQRKALLNVLPTPSQMSYRDLTNLSRNRREAYMKPTCPFCPGNHRANLRHIILECSYTRHLRNLRRHQVKDIFREYAAKAGKKINPKIVAWFDNDPGPKDPFKGGPPSNSPRGPRFSTPQDWCMG